MTKLWGKLLPSIAWLWLFGLAAACGPAPDGHIALKLSLAETAPAEGQLPPYITDFRLCVFAADLKNEICDVFNLVKYQKAGKARLGGIPPGENREVIFQGYDSALQVHWCGEVDNITIENGKTSTVSMFLTACSRFTGLRNTMATPRVFHTATRLEDGTVLLVGGFGNTQAASCPNGNCTQLVATNSIEIYQPATGSFASVNGLSLQHARGLHTATLLADGRVLIAGGCQTATWHETFDDGPRKLIEVADNGWGSAGDTVEIIDPVTGSVTTGAESLPNQRALHQSLPLGGGDVLLIGGFGPNNLSLQSAVRYQAGTGSLVVAPEFLKVARQGLVSISLGAGDQIKALLWGGNNPLATGPGTFAEILAVGADGAPFSTVPGFVEEQSAKGLPAFYAAGTALDATRVLISGGMEVDQSMHPPTDPLTKPNVLQLYRVLDLSEQAETITAPQTDGRVMHLFRAFHSSNLLPRKMDALDAGPRVLIAGGLTFTQSAADLDFSPQAQIELFLPWAAEAEAFLLDEAIEMTEARAAHTTTTLADDTLLFTGGFTVSNNALQISASGEIFNPSSRNLRLDRE